MSSSESILSCIESAQSPELTHQKKSLNTLKSLLLESENVDLFLKSNGFAILAAHVASSSGNVLSLAIQCFVALSMFPNGLDACIRSRENLYNVFLAMAAPGANASIPTHALTLFGNVCRENLRLSNLIGEIAAEFAFARRVTPCMLVAVIVDLLKSENVDLQTKALSFINILLTHCSTIQEYKKRFSLFTQLTVPAVVSKLTADFEPLRVEIAAFRNIELDMSSSQQMESQIKDITDLYTDTKNTVLKLNSDLKFYKRREPLIHLLWNEVGKLRFHLNDALSQGFLYHTNNDAPIGRFNEGYLKQLPAEDIDLMTAAALDELSPSEEYFRFSEEKNEFGGDYKKIRAGARRDSRKTKADDPKGPVNAVDVLPALKEEEDKAPETPPVGPGPIIGVGGPPIAGAPIMAVDPVVASVSAPTAVPLVAGPPAGPPVMGGPPTGFGGPPTGFSGPPTGALSGPPGGKGGIFAAPIAVQPTRKAINPNSKMKNIYWKRLLLPEVKQQLTREGKNSSDEPAESIWDSINATPEPKIDSTELEGLFAAKQVKDAVDVKVQGATTKSPTVSPQVSPRAAKPRAATKIRLIDDKRFNAISITLKRLPKLDVLAKAFRTLDATFEHDTLNLIIQALPTPEEMQTVVDSGLPESELDAAEQFILTCSRFPQISARLDCWLYKMTFEETYHDLLKPLAVISDAVETIHSSSAMMTTLALVLSIGNYLNGGTNRGQADGFDISALALLENTKDSENKINLVDYIVKQLISLYGKTFVDKLRTDLSACVDAGKFCLKNIVSDIHHFVSEAKNVKKLSTLVSSSSGAMDSFGGIMQAFNSKAEDLTAKLIDQCDFAHNAYIDMIRYYGKSKEFASRLTSDEFFTELGKFNIALGKAVGRLDELNKKAENLEKAKIAKEKQEAAKEATIAAKAKTAAASKPVMNKVIGGGDPAPAPIWVKKQKD